MNTRHWYDTEYFDFEKTQRPRTHPMEHRETNRFIIQAIRQDKNTGRKRIKGKRILDALVQRALEPHDK